MGALRAAPETYPPPRAGVSGTNKGARGGLRIEALTNRLTPSQAGSEARAAGFRKQRNWRRDNETSRMGCSGAAKGAPKGLGGAATPLHPQPCVRASLGPRAHRGVKAPRTEALGAWTLRILATAERSGVGIARLLALSPLRRDQRRLGTRGCAEGAVRPWPGQTRSSGLLSLDTERCSVIICWVNEPQRKSLSPVLSYPKLNRSSSGKANVTYKAGEPVGKLKPEFNYFTFRTLTCWPWGDSKRQTRWIGGGALPIPSAPSLLGKLLGEEARKNRTSNYEVKTPRATEVPALGPSPELLSPLPQHLSPNSWRPLGRSLPRWGAASQL